MKSSRGRVEVLLHHRAEAVDLVHEQDAARPEVREQAREVAGPLDHGAGRVRDLDAEFVREDGRERGLAEARRAVEKYVVHGFLAAARGLEEHGELLPHGAGRRSRPAGPGRSFFSSRSSSGNGAGSASRPGWSLGARDLGSAMRSSGIGGSARGAAGRASRPSERFTSSSSVRSGSSPPDLRTASCACRRRIAERHERRDRVVARSGAAARPPLPRAAGAGAPATMNSSLSRSSTTMRSAVFLPMPGTATIAAICSSRIACAPSATGTTRRARRARSSADAADADEQVEELQLLGRGETEQQLRILAHDVARAEPHFGTDGRQLGERVRGHLHEVTDPSRLDDARAVHAFEQGPAQRRDHRVLRAISASSGARPRCGGAAPRAPNG